MLRKYLGIFEKYTVHMKYSTTIILMGLSLPVRAHADIALNPLHANGIAIVIRAEYGSAVFCAADVDI